jgi:hypothetical protein
MDRRGAEGGGGAILRSAQLGKLSQMFEKCIERVIGLFCVMTFWTFPVFIIF